MVLHLRQYSHTLTDQVVFCWLLGKVLTPVVIGLGPGRVSPSWATASVKLAAAAWAWASVPWIVLISTWNLLAQTRLSSQPRSTSSNTGCPTARLLAWGTIALFAFLAPRDQGKGWQCNIGRQREAGSYWVWGSGLGPAVLSVASSHIYFRFRKPYLF